MASTFPIFYSKFGPGKEFYTSIEERGYFEERLNYAGILQILTATTGIFYDYQTLIIPPSKFESGAGYIFEKTKDWIDPDKIADDAGFVIKKAVIKVYGVRIENVTRGLVEKYHEIDVNGKSYYLQLKIVCRAALGQISLKGPKGVTIDSQNINGIDHFRMMIPFSNLDEFAIVISSSSLEDFMFILKITNFNYSTSNIAALIKIFKNEIKKAGNDPDKLDIIYFLAPTEVLNAFSEDELWRDLGHLLTSNLNAIGTDEEAAVLNIFRSLVSPERLGELFAENPKADELLDALLTKKVEGRTMFDLLYNKINDYGGADNFTALMDELFIVWIMSTHITSGYEYSVDYKSEKSMGFYEDNLNFEFTEDNQKIQLYQRPKDAYFQDKIEVQQTLPIYGRVVLVNPLQVEAPGVDFVPSVMPTFYLKAIDDKIASANAETAFFFALDLITSLTGFGNLLKFKNLYRALKLTEKGTAATALASKAKIFISGYEIFSGTAGAMITIANDESHPLCQSMRECLFFMDMISLGGDALISRMLKKSAQNALNIYGNAPKAHLLQDVVDILEKLAGAKAHSVKVLNVLDLKKLLKGIISENDLNQLLRACDGLGLKVSKNLSPEPPFGVGIYQISYNGVEVLDGGEDYLRGLFTKLDEVYSGSSSGRKALKKYLFDLDNTAKIRKLALSKHLRKFDSTFGNHIFGEIGLRDVTYKLGAKTDKDEFLEFAQGGHVWNDKIKLQTGKTLIPDPPVFDLPYKADIEINYKGEWFSKKQTSSMFPEGWTLQRIQEEVAWVHDHTVNMNFGFYRKIVSAEGKTIHQYIGKSLAGFDVLIEIDDLKNLINAHPNL